LNQLDAPLADSRWPTLRATTEWLIRQLQVARGRGPLIDYVRRLAEAEGERAQLSPTQLAAQVAIGAIERLHDALESLPIEATPLEWMDALSAVATRLGLELDDTPGSAWRAVQEGAAWIVRTHRSGLGDDELDEAEFAWTLAECVEYLQDVC